MIVMARASVSAPVSAPAKSQLRLPTISVYNGEDESITALTDDGMEELEQMLSSARRSTDEWNDFLDCFVDDEELVARFKAKSPR
ncbi:hypothetical protein ACXHXM_35580